MSLKIITNKGELEVAKDVIANIASIGAMECYGVAGISINRFSESFSELIKKDTTKKGIRIEVTEENKLLIELNIIVIYGTKISEVAHNVIEKVHYMVEDITGIKVEKINIIVQGVKVLD